MKSAIAQAAVAALVCLSVGAAAAQEGAGKRDFEAEITTALQTAKTAAGFEFPGTLVRTCLLPQSGREDTSDNRPAYVTNPASAPPRDTWHADPAKVFDNLYFVGGRIHSSWALTTSDGIILIDTIFPYNKNRMLAGRGTGTHPYEVGAEWVQRYFRVMQNCARAAQLRLEQRAATR